MKGARRTARLSGNPAPTFGVHLKCRAHISDSAPIGHCSRLVSFVFCCVLLFCLNLRARSDKGRISGKILDRQGVAVAGARLKLLNSASALIREAKSDQQGYFALDNIEPGEYQLKAKSASLVSVVQDVSVTVGQQKEINLQFRQLGSVLQSITVVASSRSGSNYCCS
jgi:hypothetical protein